MKNRGEKHLFLLHFKEFKGLFSLKLRGFKLDKKGHSGPEFFFGTPLKVSFVGPDVLCRYLFSLRTGQQKAAGIMMERQNHTDIVAGPYKRWLCALM